MTALLTYKLSDDLRKLLLSFLLFALITFLLLNPSVAIDSIGPIKASNIPRRTLVGGFSAASIFVGSLYFLRLLVEVADAILFGLKADIQRFSNAQTIETLGLEATPGPAGDIPNKLRTRGRRVAALRTAIVIIIILFDLVIPLIVMYLLLRSTTAAALLFIQEIYTIKLVL